MVLNGEFLNNPETSVVEVKKYILKHLNEKNRIRVTGDIGSQSSWSSNTFKSENLMLDNTSKKSRNNFVDHATSYYTQPGLYVSKMPCTLSYEKCEIDVGVCRIDISNVTLDNRFISVVLLRKRIYFDLWLRLVTYYRSIRVLRDHNRRLILLFWKYELHCHKRARCHHDITVKSHSLLIWMSYLQGREKKNKSKVIANAHYRHQVLQNYLTCWKRNYFLTGESTFEKSLFSAARAHNRRSTLRRAFCVWVSRNQFCQRRMTLRKTAINFLQNTLNRRIIMSVIQQWYHQVLYIQMSNKHNRCRILKTILNIWSCRTEVNIMERRMYSSAHNLHSVKLRLRYFLLWRNYIVYKRKKRKQISILIQFRKINQMKKYFNAWVCYRSLVIDRHNIIQCMLMKHHTSLVKQCLSKWKDYLLIKQSLLSKLSHFKECEESKLLNEYFQCWLRNLHFKKSQELAISNFKKQKSMQYMKKILIMWFQWAFTHREHRLQTQLTFEQSLRCMRILITQFWWSRWRSLYRYCSNIHLACKLHNKHILDHCFSGWSTFITNAKNKTKLIKMARDFQNRTIQNQFLNQWHSRLIEKAKFQTLNSIALIRWSLCLQLKVWKAWCLWIKRQKHKKNKRQIATQRYFEHKTVDALRLWITVALNKRHERHIEYCSKFWNSDSRVFKLVLNIATHWYWRTFSRCDSQHVGEFNANDVCVDISASAFENRISKLSEYRRCFSKIQNQELTAPRCPDFILPELNSTGLTNVVQSIQTPTHTPSLNETFSHVKNNCGDICYTNYM
ncbi:Protein SFI1 isoform 3, partial [Schistosoma japonicum]